MARICAVLTGDLIGSSAAPPQAVAATMANLSTTADLARGFTGCDLRFTRFRGDGWQMLLERPEQLYRLLILILARRRADPLCLNTRIAIGIGTVDSPGSRDLNDARGPAFTESGQMLDRMAHGTETEAVFANSAETFPVAGLVELIDAPTDALLAFLTFLAQGWTLTQAEAVAQAALMGDPNLNRLADILGITRQAVAQRLRGAGWTPIFRAMEAFGQRARLWQDPGIR